MNFLLGQQAPGADELYDIVVLEPVPSSWPLIFAGVLGVILMALSGLAVLYFLKRKNQKADESPVARVKSRLLEIEKTRINLAPNQFSLAVSDALKDYLSEKFNDPVRYETSQEFLKRNSGTKTHLPEPARQLLLSFLTESEEVKFGHTADADTKLLPLLQRADEIVNVCERPQEEKKAS